MSLWLLLLLLVLSAVVALIVVWFLTPAPESPPEPDLCRRTDVVLTPCRTQIGTNDPGRRYSPDLDLTFQLNPVNRSVCLSWCQSIATNYKCPTDDPGYLECQAIRGTPDTCLNLSPVVVHEGQDWWAVGRGRISCY